MPEQTTPTDTTDDEHSTDQSRPAPDDHDFSGVPAHNETVSKEILDDSFDGKRRVERTYQRIISDGDQITYIHTGDTLVRAHDAEPHQNVIEDIGPELSSSDGMHVMLTDVDTPVHLNLVRKWIENGDAIIYGTRQSEFSEVEGVDY